VDTIVIIINVIYALIAGRHSFGKTELQNIHDVLRFSGTGSSTALLCES
jgi:hypothetical protein